MIPKVSAREWSCDTKDHGRRQDDDARSRDQATAGCRGDWLLSKRSPDQARIVAYSPRPDKAGIKDLMMAVSEEDIRCNC